MTPLYSQYITARVLPVDTSQKYIVDDAGVFTAHEEQCATIYILNYYIIGSWFAEKYYQNYVASDAVVFTAHEELELVPFLLLMCCNKINDILVIQSS